MKDTLDIFVENMETGRLALPPSLGQWLEVGAALDLSCSANGVLALLVRRHDSVLVLGLCGVLLALPFAVPYAYPISASAHALVAFIGAWKAVDMLAGARPQAAGGRAESAASSTCENGISEW